MSTRDSRRPTTKLTILIMALALTASGCFLGEPLDRPCDCPNLERIAGTLNWLPNTPNSIVFTPWVDEHATELQVNVKILTDTPDAATQQIAERLGTAGFQYDDVTREAHGQGFIVGVYTSAGTIDGSPVVYVSILFEGGDDQAEQILTPLIDTLGLQDREGIKFCGSDTDCAATAK